MFSRSLYLVGLLAAGALATAPAAHAQTTPTPDQATAAGQGRAGRQAEMMKALNLTPDQQAKMEALMSANRTARPSGPPSDADRQAMQARRADMETKMKEILTPEQYAKYEAMRPQRGQRPSN